MPSTRQPSAEMMSAYRHGRDHQHSGDLMALAYADPDVGRWWDDDVLGLFWRAGWRGEPVPRWVEAERYGGLPSSGRSRNYADSRTEAGVSVARVLDPDADDGYRWAMGSWGAADRPTVRVAGWLHHRRGSDGEPLLVGAITLTHQEAS